MRDRLSVMLDSMITAVDEGLSYDGIVSMPDAGLEDFGRRPGIAGWLDDSVEAFCTTKATISRVVDKLRFKVVPSNRTQRGSNRNSWVRPSARDSRASNQDNRISVADSKFSPEKCEVRPTSLIVPSLQDSSTPVNPPPLQNSAVMQEGHATLSRVPRLRRPSSQGSPSAALRDSVISSTVASRASHIDEESSERIQSQHSPVGSPTATRRTQSSTPQGSAASQAAPDADSSEKDTIHTRHGLQDPQASYVEEGGPHKGEAARSPHSRDQTLAQEDPQVSHIGGESSLNVAAPTQHSHSDTSERDPRKKIAPQDIVASQPASHSEEESSRKAEDAQTHWQHSPVTIPVPSQETQSSASRDLVPSQPRKPREAPPTSLDAGTQNDEAQHSPSGSTQRLPRQKDKQESKDGVTGQGSPQEETGEISDVPH